ncbi:integrase catalytic domain-containing protein [Trichonephila clavipes]|nr:integrase catalytic domain-containing protein [Trichonephila clavipes]
MSNFPIKNHEWPHIKDLTLADPTFYIENEIDILLGADVFMTLISGTPILGPKDYSLKQFWELESVPKDIPSKDEDELCESIFVNSHIRNADGRYILKLPFRDDSSIGDITYGTSCAPFLAIRTLKQLCEDEKHRFPQAAKLAKDHFYVDNLLAGADSLDSARKIVHELQNLMSADGFELRKWSCTHPEVLSDLPNTLKTNISSHSFDDESTQKILGLFWDLNEDSFKEVKAVLSDQVSTKRQMLSIIARIFDPLGFVSPSTIILKIILQDLWKAGLDWDDEISSDILNRWNRFQAEISCLKQIKVPRGLYPKQLLEKSEWVAGPKWLHDFHPSSNSFIPFSEQPVSLVPIDQSESLSDSAVLSTGVDYSLSFLDKFSSYMKVVKTVAWIFRFYHNSKSVSKVTGPLYTHELETSIKRVVKLLQNGEYHTELTLLKCNKPLPKSSKLQSLNVFLDSEGILRVGGRLRLQQTLKFEQKHPMLIPKEHHFTSLVIRHFHRVNFHAGQELVLSLIRQQF